MTLEIKGLSALRDTVFYEVWFVVYSRILYTKYSVHTENVHILHIVHPACSKRAWKLTCYSELGQCVTNSVEKKASCI